MSIVVRREEVEAALAGLDPIPLIEEGYMTVTNSEGELSMKNVTANCKLMIVGIGIAKDKDDVYWATQAFYHHTKYF